ncbi:MAG: DoxX family protein [Verrucomicrobiae bacterium]|nr:DoxX family protein [Verrucomicrobiae bacterium]
MSFLTRITTSQGARAVPLIRLMVGGVFVSEGIQKFLFPAEVGAGRFEKIGLPNPEFLGAFVGGFEIVCGALILLGLLTRLAAIPLLAIMSVALYTTKIPILFKAVFFKMVRGPPTDSSFPYTALFLLVVGAGAWSLDAVLARRAGRDSKPASRADS